MGNHEVGEYGIVKNYEEYQKIIEGYNINDPITVEKFDNYDYIYYIEYGYCCCDPEYLKELIIDEQKVSIKIKERECIEIDCQAISFNLWFVPIRDNELEQISSFDVIEEKACSNN